MKYIVVLLVVAVGLWLLLRGRRQDADERSRAAPPPPPEPGARLTAMVACTRCGLHLPQHDALADGQGRLFCGPEHRDAGTP